MANRKIQNSKYLQSLELQVFSYIIFLEEDLVQLKKLEHAFLGIATPETLKDLIHISPFFNIQNEQVKVLKNTAMANITYNFQSDNPNFLLEICGKQGEAGTGLLLQEVELQGPDRRIKVKVVMEGVGNWTLNVRRIQVTNPEDMHERQMDPNPITRSGSHLRGYDTYRN